MFVALSKKRELTQAGSIPAPATGSHPHLTPFCLPPQSLVELGQGFGALFHDADVARIHAAPATHKSARTIFAVFSGTSNAGVTESLPRLASYNSHRKLMPKRFGGRGSFFFGGVLGDTLLPPYPLPELPGRAIIGLRCGERSDRITLSEYPYRPSHMGNNLRRDLGRIP